MKLISETKKSKDNDINLDSDNKQFPEDIIEININRNPNRETYETANVNDEIDNALIMKIAKEGCKNKENNNDLVNGQNLK